MEDKFESFVVEAIDHIPTKYKDKMKHVAILIEDYPTLKQRQEIGLRSCDALFGLYQGMPLPKRGGQLLQVPPDVITIFKYPMLDIFTNEDDLKNQIYQTLWHETAHFFGLNHSQIHRAQKGRQ